MNSLRHSLLFIFFGFLWGSAAAFGSEELQCKWSIIPAELRAAMSAGIQGFQKSKLGKGFEVKRFIQSINYLLKNQFKVPEDHIFLWFLKPNESVKDDPNGNAEQQLKTRFSKFYFKHESSAENVVLAVRFGDLTEFLAILSDSYPLIKGEIGIVDQARRRSESALHRVYLGDKNARNYKLTPSQVENAMKDQSGDRPSRVLPLTREKQGNVRIYQILQRQILLETESMTINHSFGSKYDGIVGPAVSEVIADMIRMNLENYPNLTNRGINLPFRLGHIHRIEVDVLEMKRLPQTDIPYAIKFRLLMVGTQESNPGGILFRQEGEFTADMDACNLLFPFIQRLSFSAGELRH